MRFYYIQHRIQLIIFKQPGKPIPDDFSIKLGKDNVKPQNKVKLLGVTLDHHLNFSNHIDDVIQRAHGTLGILRKAASRVPREILKLAYIALVRSVLEYCSCLLFPVSKTNQKKLETVQKIASRIICNAPRMSHAEPLLQSLQLQPLSVRRELHVLKLVEQIIKGNCHPAIVDILGETTTDELSETKCRTAVGRRRFSIFAAKTYNANLQQQPLS